MTIKSHSKYLPEEKDYGKYWAIDIEGDGLPSSRVWVATAKNVGTGEELRYTDYSALRAWIEGRLQEGCFFIAHNGIEYDFPTLNRVVGTRFTIGRLIDTMVMSMVYSPSIAGGHGLGAWGERLRFPKGEWSDWSRYSLEMEDYCMNDTRLLVLVFKALVNRMTKVGFSEDGLDIEHRSWQLIRTQKKNGFKFNKEEAHVLYSKLRGIENDIRQSVYEYWPPRLECVFTGNKSRKADGTHSANYLRHIAQYSDVRERDDGKYDCFENVYINLGSPSQRVSKLVELGWQPREFTKPSKSHPRGQPQPLKKGKLSPSLEEFVSENDVPAAKLLAKWIEINARANMINTWIEACDDRSGCIHGSLWLANTLRYRHSAPNTANIPAVRLAKDANGIEHPVHGEAGVWTYEARDLWMVRADNRVLVGVDAKGIQLRVLAHYLNNAKFTESVLSQDPHSANQAAFGLPSRSLTKTITYAVLMGSGDALTASTAKISIQEAKDVKKMFFSQVPELPKLIASLKKQAEDTGRIILCDRTPIIVKHPHMVIPYLLQGDESRIMKKAAILADLEIRKKKLDVLKVGDIHDEWQNDVLRDHSEEFAFGVCPRAFNGAGRHFNYNLPVDCDAKIGLTWAETH